jgi:hypothetical protein
MVRECFPDPVSGIFHLIVGIAVFQAIFIQVPCPFIPGYNMMAKDDRCPGFRGECREKIPLPPFEK